MISPFKLNATLGRDYNADLGDTLRIKNALSPEESPSIPEGCPTPEASMEALKIFQHLLCYVWFKNWRRIMLIQ